MRINRNAYALMKKVCMASSNLHQLNEIILIYSSLISDQARHVTAEDGQMDAEYAI